MNNVMIDIETLGVSVTAPILSVGAVFFTPETGSLGKEFYQIVSIKSALEHGVVEPATLSWWMQQSRDARSIFYDKSSVSLPETLTALGQFMAANTDPLTVNVWGNGSSFDNAILSNIYNRLGMKLPWNFRNDRDVRTIVHLANIIKNKNVLNLNHREGVHHNALDDAKYQAKYVATAYSLLSE